jgi:molybdopterin biosynthesis enzyme
MVEYTDKDGEKVSIERQVATSRNMAEAGADMTAGTHVLSPDKTITPGVIGALAALGYIKVEVYRKPRVAIYSSGPEIAPQGQALKPGQIYDINGYKGPVQRGHGGDGDNLLPRRQDQAGQADAFRGG